MTPLPKLLRNRLFSTRDMVKQKPRKLFRPNRVRSVKIDVSLRRDRVITLGYVIAPMMHIDGKWHYFYNDDRPLASLVRQSSINGVKSSDIGFNIYKASKLWEKWLRQWLQDNDLKLKIEKDERIEKETEVKKKVKKVKKDDRLEPNEDDEPEDILEHSLRLQDSLPIQ